MAPDNSIIAKTGSVKTKRSLILAGGGVRVAYQAGVLKALEEEQLEFNHIDGTSGGIFNTAMLASGLSPDECAMRWKNLNLSYFISGLPFKKYLNPARLTAFGDGDGIRKKVFPSLGIDPEKIRNNKNITATFNVCNFSDKTVESITNNMVTEDHLIAGVSLPVFMPAISIDHNWYSDAVWIKDANLMEAVKRGAEEIWLVWAIGNSNEYLPGSFNQYVHMIEMSANGGLFEELMQIEDLNERISKGDSPYGQKNPIILHVIKPDFPLPLDPELFLNKIDTTTLINIGYSDAKKYLNKIPEKGISFGKESTKMNEPGVTLNFRQNYEGNLEFEKVKCFFRYSPAFNLRNRKGELSLHFHSSIYIETLGREISTEKNETHLRHNSGKQTIVLNSEFETEGGRYFVSATIILDSMIDWMHGMEFKKIKLQVSKIDRTDRQVLTDGFLTQGTVKRIKNCFHSSLSNYYGKGFKVKEKFKMISNLYRNEI